MRSVKLEARRGKKTSFQSSMPEPRVSEFYSPPASVLALISMRKDAFIKFKPHADESTLACNVFPGQDIVTEPYQVITGGEPHVSETPVTGFKTHSILLRVVP